MKTNQNHFLNWYNQTKMSSSFLYFRIHFFLRRAKRKIQNFLWPQCRFIHNGWNYREYNETPTVIRCVLFNCLIDFVESKDGKNLQNLLDIAKVCREGGSPEEISEAQLCEDAHKKISELYPFCKNWREDESFLLIHNDGWEELGDFESKTVNACLEIVKIHDFLVKSI